MPSQTEIVSATSALLSGKIVDENGTGIAGSTILTLKLTMYELDSGSKAVINSHASESLAPATYVNASGNLSYPLTVADNTIIVSGALSQRCRAVFVWTWGSPAKTARGQIDWIIVKDDKP